MHADNVCLRQLLYLPFQFYKLIHSVLQANTRLKNAHYQIIVYGLYLTIGCI